MRLEDKAEAVASELDQAGLFFGHGTDNAFDEAVWLILEAAGLDPSGDDVPWQASLSADQCQAVDTLLARRIETHQPLAYLVNRAWFGGRDFFVDSRAIVPRSHIGEWIS
jgi:ribosomal protein L3 glutamine methyltransferase